ncbi:MAG TPA: AMP-binding protein [Myxococcota bacterium]|nr:AMP-binding protein [Myxococcota bacterium]HQK50238.1 AMP-binding protein [Myxococcota bacterium]
MPERSPSLPAFLRSRARSLGPKPALIVSTPRGDALWTFADLWMEVRRQATEFLDRGLCPRSPVLLAGRPSPETLLTELALQAVQCFAIRLAPDLPVDRLSDAARATEVPLVMHRGLPADRLEALMGDLPDVPVLPVPEPIPPTGRPLDGTEDPRLEGLVPSGPDGAAVAVLPEGSADLVLARLLTQRNLLGLGERVGLELGGTEQDVWWVPVPGYGAAPYTAGLAPAWISGGIVGLVPDVADPMEGLWRIHPTVAVTRAREAEQLADRLLEEVAGAAGWNGRLARWAVRAATGPGRNDPLVAVLDALVGHSGRSVLKALIGGRLDRLVVLGDLSDRAADTFAAFQVTTFLARGPLVAADLWTLDRLPVPDARGTLVPGTEVRLDAEGRLEVRGISATRRLALKGWRSPERTEDWLPTYCPGSLSGQRLHWTPPAGAPMPPSTKTL